ncbi:hypothetical protein, partial [Aphanothece microscopica]|uniref:hypothetical protein n=1 Tax=Aphanothece microscopica TaxID=1049561 RepID=UPI003CE52E82
MGVYGVISRDRLTADLQLRYDSTSFDVTETPIEDDYEPTVDGTRFSTSAITLSSRVSYAIELNDEGLSFVPTGGVAYTRNQGSTLTFDGGETLTIDAFDSIVGFVGGTLARTVISPEGNAGTTYFVSGNYYQ